MNDSNAATALEKQDENEPPGGLELRDLFPKGILKPLAGFLVFGAFAASWWWVDGAEITSLGAFGDSFGFITSLASFFALIATATAVHLQRQELILQRKELEASRKEMVNQRSVMEGQKAQMGRHAELLEQQIESQNKANRIAEEVVSKQERANVLTEKYVEVLNHQTRRQAFANVIASFEAEVACMGPHSGAAGLQSKAKDLVRQAESFPHTPL